MQISHVPQHTCNLSTQSWKGLKDFSESRKIGRVSRRAKGDVFEEGARAFAAEAGCRIAWAGPAGEELEMEIQRVGSRPSVEGPSDWFTGTARIDPLFEHTDPARARGVSVTFEPGARTAWHSHPLGQTLIVTEGCGRVQRWGGPVEEVRPGDVICFAPGEKHWHGAAPTTAMTHLAIHEALDGEVVEWMEMVSDDQYEGRSAGL